MTAPSVSAGVRVAHVIHGNLAQRCRESHRTHALHQNKILMLKIRYEDPHPVPDRIPYESRKAKKAYKKENKLRQSSVEEQNVISRAVMWIRARIESASN